MNDELMNWVIESIRGAILREVAFGDAAVRLEFSKSDTFSWSVFRLKTANFFSLSENSGSDYEAEVAGTMTPLYQCLGAQLLNLTYSNVVATLTFDNGMNFFVHDREGIWDNLFSIELENKDGRSEYLYGVREASIRPPQTPRSAP